MCVGNSKILMHTVIGIAQTCLAINFHLKWEFPHFISIKMGMKMCLPYSDKNHRNVEIVKICCTE